MSTAFLILLTALQQIIPAAFYARGKDDIENEKEYFDGWYDRRMAIKQLEKGDVLLTYKFNGVMIFFQWLVFERVYIRAVNLSFSIPDSTAYMAYTYTLPEHRRMKVASMAKARALKYLRGLGYKKAFILVKPENEPSIKVNRNAGFREYQTLYYRRFFLFLQYYLVKDCASDREKVFWGIGKTDKEIWSTFSQTGLPG